jgi:predicted regulator of Ras-like GTPase activity (Roadblock/LC7/MglB family)
MHWFESQLTSLDQLAEAYRSSQPTSFDDIVEVSEEICLKRSQFVHAVQALVNKVVRIKGITACAAYHDGLILAHSGKMPHIDALGAMIQESTGIAQQSSAVLSLGEIEQIVIVGATNKIAMLGVGPITLCILSPRDINLAHVLGHDIKKHLNSDA